MNGFPDIQRAYAAHGVATYPLNDTKKPAVKFYNKIGNIYSAHLVLRFPEALAAGFNAGPRNRLTVVDIDSSDDRLFDEIQTRYGVTPLVVLTPSGGRHLYFRHYGEVRRIRPLPDVDVLGAGNVVAVGSKTSKGRYQIERGSLDDLDRLPRLASAPTQPESRQLVPEGKRNEALHRYLRSIVVHCDDLETLIDVARTWSDSGLAGGLPDAEIVKTAGSVWRFRGGRKLFMQHIVEGPLFGKLIANPEVWTLCSYLMIEQGPDAEFMIADGLSDARGWPRRLVPKARKALLSMGIVECVRQPRKNAPGIYRWRSPQ
jgi:hypothetical protein